MSGSSDTPAQGLPFPLPDGSTDGPGVAACCSAIYGSPLAELLVGQSLHPGGLASTRALLAAGGISRGDRLLDAGCGLGASSRLAERDFGLEVDAVDASAEVIAKALSRGGIGIRWTRADLSRLPFGDAAFDAVLAECVLSTADRPTVLTELRRTTRRGGLLLLSDVEATPEASGLLGRGGFGTALCIGDAWRPGELGTRLPAAGYRIERRWDRSTAITEMLDRIADRLHLASMVTRGTGVDVSGLARAAGLSAVADAPETAHEAADGIRHAVADGTLRYVAVVARAW